ncbi:DUF1800 domain-containing protein [Brevundimonas sp.]|uniref:DUF1800 domain-containing protein n=1 Tax=Brevundimonas sp. TaxID=1871086 RepID=UPI0025C6AE22|nr:DUF1800 domain-containing protein [Brevundimonas sp.]MCG2663483.1 DUF1800 domain-containing protein [Brevundimonas sp.]
MAASSTDAAIAVTRLGLGARPGEIARVAADPRAWALAQIRSEGALQPAGPFADSGQRMAAFLDYQGDRGQRAGASADAEAVRTARQAARRALADDTAQAFLTRARLGATTADGFAERWALFWANALTVSAVKFDSGAFIDLYEREAVRPNVFGRFEDLVVAAEQHPAMLLYLDQARSTGPDSPAGTRRKVGLNENLAREMLELHTVGADAGYTQADVTELARALTGWSIPRPQDRQAAPGRDRARRAAQAVEPGPNGFVFRANIHEPGPRTVMGRTYAQRGAAQGEAILRDLARHPATARRLSRRIAAHFVADTPPEPLVARLEQAWRRSDGDLAQVARALVEAPETWTPQPTKIKTPYEFIVSTHRALDVPPQRIQPLRQALIEMGQPPFAAPSPEGWPDTAADWAGPDALVKRLNWARTAAETARTADIAAAARDALGDRLSERTRLAVARAESRTEALTLLLMSPEFQRR